MTRIVALVPDLMDRSKLEAAVRKAGASLQLVASAVDLAPTGGESAEQVSGADVVILDLNRPGAIDALKELSQVRTVGFASHVDRDLMETARRAGCQEVMARSRFFSCLERLLAPSPGPP